MVLGCSALLQVSLKGVLHVIHSTPLNPIDTHAICLHSKEANNFKKPLLIVQWDVEPWGSWRVWARNEDYEGLVEATCDSPGTPLRAPTADRGLDVYCRDSFFGKVGHREASCPNQAQHSTAALHLLMHAEFLLDYVLDVGTLSVLRVFTLAHNAFPHQAMS